MSLTDEQIKELKRQLSQQIQHLPADKKAEAQKQIDSLSPGALELMLKQQSQNDKSQNKGSQKILRMIVSGDIPSKKIDENKDAIAVLDIKPLSKGHTIIILKKEVSNLDKLPKTAFSLAKKIGKKITSKLKATSFEVLTEIKFEEVIINVIPVYDRPVSLNSPRSDASEPELATLQSKLKAREKSKVIKINTKKKPVVYKLSRKIP